MEFYPSTLLLLNLALAFYNVGAIWAHQVDIFPSWRLVGADNFERVHTFHWRSSRSDACAQQPTESCRLVDGNNLQISDHAVIALSIAPDLICRID